MVGDYKSEGQQLMQTLLHAPRPRHRRAADSETGRFVHTGNDTTINLIPVFTAVIIGIAALAVLLTGALGGASGSLPFTAAAKAGVEPALAQPPAPAVTAQGYYQYQTAAQDPAQYYYQPVQPQQYPAAQDQAAPQPQPRVNLPYQPPPVHQLPAQPQEYSTDALQLDIYEKLSNLQVELKKLQDAEQLLSNALSTKYLDLQQ